LARVGCAGEETLAGMVVAINARMGDARERGEMAAIRSEKIEVRTGGLVGFWKEKLGHHSEGDMDGQQSFWGEGFCCTTH
jgi:hypothetical protein